MKRGALAFAVPDLLVGALLILLLGLMFLAAHTVPDPWRGPAVFGFASLEALTVAAFLMKLARAPALFLLAAFAGLFWVSALVVMVMTDYPFRQTGERPRTFPDAAPAAAIPSVGSAIPDR